MGSPRKDEILAKISTQTGVKKEHVDQVLEAYSNLIVEEMSPTGCGEFTLRGIFRIYRSIRKATPAKTVPNVFDRKTATIEIPAQPEKSLIRIKPLGRLKQVE